MRPVIPTLLSVVFVVTVAASCVEGALSDAEVSEVEAPLLYGDDDRRQPFEVNEPALRSAIDATVVLVNRSLLTPVVSAGSRWIGLTPVLRWSVTPPPGIRNSAISSWLNLLSQVAQ